MERVADKELERMKRRTDLDESRFDIKEQRLAIQKKQFETLVEALKEIVKEKDDDAWQATSTKKSF